LAVVDDGFVKLIALIDRARAREITAGQFDTELGQLSDELEARIEDALAGPGPESERTADGPPTAGSDDGDGLPYPLNRWRFWVFVAPEALIFVGSVLIYTVGGGLGLGALWRRLRRAK
jgi:hypothetical protein